MPALKPVAPPDPSGTIAALQQQVAVLQQQVVALQQKNTDLMAPVYAKYRAWEMANYDEKIQMMNYRVHLYHGQDFSGAVMMWTAVAVVAAGLVLSAAQLISAMRLGRNDDGTMDVSLTGIKITSSVTGLLILGMSLAFTYIFIQQVYTIHEPPIAAGAAPTRLPDQPAAGNKP